MFFLFAVGTTLILILTKLHRKVLDSGVTFFSMLYFLRLCWCPINTMPNATSEESPSGNRRQDCGSAV